MTFYYLVQKVSLFEILFFLFCFSVNNFSKNQIHFKKCFSVTKNVSSLYPNIDHDERVGGCMNAYEKRSNKNIPSNYLCGVLKQKRYYQRIVARRLSHGR